MKHKLLQGNNLDLLKKLPDNSVDSVVTDPPYGLSFMNKKWDYDVPSVDFWKEVFRVLKPGGHVLSFGGTRTYHRMVVNMEDAGFEIRDQIQWIYGSGFPKSLNIGKAVDKLEGNEREVVGVLENYQNKSSGGANSHMMEEIKPRIDINITKGNSPWEGWGTCLKPANEPICLARKPLSEKSVVENVLKWGTGGINIDGCRIEVTYSNEHVGRFPANIILDEEAGQILDEQSGYLKSGEVKPHHRKNKTANGYQGSCYGKFKNEDTTLKGYGDGGGASRFFYQAKVSKKERNMGLEEVKSNHPTMKPVQLMSYLCRLITPPNGIVLDPFMGSGSTGISARLEGFRFIGMEMDEDYFKIAEGRIGNWEKYKK